MPKPSETLTPADREAARGQAEKQAAIGKRTDDIAEEAARRLGKMPGMEKAAGELKGAGARMKEAGESLKRDESKPAATAERDAADRLGKLRDSMRERSMGAPSSTATRCASRAPTIERAARLAAGAARRHERAGARALPRRMRRYYEELVK